MSDKAGELPEVLTDEAKRAKLAQEEIEQGVVDQQAAGAAKPDEKPAD